MKKIKLILSLACFTIVILTVSNSFSQLNDNYSFKLQFEGEFNNNTFFASGFNLNSPDNYFTMSSTPSPFEWGVCLPEIIYVDQNQNYYLTDRKHKLNIYDSSNTLLAEITFPETFEFSSLYINSDNRLIYELSNSQKIKHYLDELHFEKADVFLTRKEAADFLKINS